MAAPRCGDVCLTEDEVNQITDLFQAFQWIQKLDINPSGITDVEGAKCRLLHYLKEQYGAGKHQRADVSEIMKEVLDKDRQLRTQLVDLYREVETYVIQLPKSRRKELERSIPDLGQQIHDNVCSLERSDCHILVAGEVSAGKSSLLNLILGRDLLPTSLLSCTSTICELRYASTKYALAYSMDSTQPAERVNLNEGNPAEILANYVHQRGDRLSKFPYKRVEIYWPFPLLQGGIVIVDSPGIGESREMTRVVKQFLPTAFAFIYVINSSNAGGLQPDRLQDLLAQISRQNGESSMFNPRSAIFVCNKWDLVPLEEVDQVRADTCAKLRTCWSGVHNSQIFEMSTTKASKSLKESGYVTQDLAHLLEGIEALLPISLRCKLEVHYRWLMQLLRRSAFYLRVHIANETRSDEDRKELTEHLTNQLDRLHTEANRVMAELKAEVYERAQKACDDLITHLDSPATRARLLLWQESECPDGNDWEALQELLIAKVNKRIRREVNDWDQRNGVFNEIQMGMLHKFQQEFELMEDQLGVIEGNMIGSRCSRIDTQAALRQMHLQQRPNLTTGQKIALGVAAPILLPLGVVAGFFVLPVAGVRAIRNKLSEMKLLRSYKENKEKTLTTMTQEILNSFIEKSALSRLIREQLQVVTANMETMLSSIPNIVDADRILIERLQNERNQSEVALAEQLLPMYQKCVEHQGKLDLFFAERIRTYDVDVNDLVWDPSRPPIASGTFGDVYAGMWRNGNDNEIPVAVKLRREPLDQSNITELLIEEENLRRLNHENIVKYHGTCARRQDAEGPLQILMLMEKCESTLRARIIGKKAKNPGKLGDNKAMMLEAQRRVRSYCSQLCAALMYMHERGLVHRDLKPQNILLNKLEVVKIADVGLTKPERDISGTICGSTSYSAPEVMEGISYDKAADMYSFAIIAWELWYGRSVADELLSLQKGSIENAVRSGARPRFSAEAPSTDWRDVIELCWNGDPRKRLSANQSYDYFNSLKDI